uniref:complement subcomponent C1r n=1 Tax=Dicentrarchus labrax TaxID=13489 RepID=A0A8C4F8J9_DICLA
MFIHNSRCLCLSVTKCSQLPDSQPVMHREVHSPQYPRPYPPNLLKQWDIWVSKGYLIQLSLTHLDIKASSGCHQDSLTVLYDQKVLGTFCGQENSRHHPGKVPILSQDNRLTLIFQTNDSSAELQQHIGFSATYKAIDVDECSNPDPGDGSGPLCSQICINTPGSYHCSCRYGYKLQLDQLSCGGCIFDKHEGHLSSPGYPGPSPPFLSCKYIISVDPRFTVTLNFTDNFHIDNNEKRPTIIQINLPLFPCPGLIDTNSSTVRLDYHTDDKGLSQGWSLDYSTYKVKCPVLGNVAKGKVTLVLTEYFDRDYIYVTCDQGYKLMMDGREIKMFSATCQSNGQWTLPLPECHIIDCGEPKPLLNGGVTFLSGFQNQYRSVVQYHCNEPFYSLLGGVNFTFTCEADRKWRSNHDTDVTATCIPVCGQPINHISAYQRIIGGSEAPDNTIPWQVLLSVDGLRAGGMVIADRWIMTAAHVLQENGNIVPNEILRVYMGLTNVNTLRQSPVYTASIHVHPEYNNPNNVNFNNDIALIKLREPITFRASVMPVCLPEKGATYVTGMMGLVSGFGLTERLKILTNMLKYVQLPVVEQETCRASITSAKKKRNSVPSLTNNMFCAGVPEGGKDSCQGDNGGPFTLSNDGRVWAAGIVSWGVDCGQQGTYGVYTRVANYLDWINKTMQEN